MGCFMYVIFGTSKDIAMGPAAILAFLTAEHASKDPAFVVLLTFLTGIIIMLLGFLRLGKSLKCGPLKSISVKHEKIYDHNGPLHQL